MALKISGTTVINDSRNIENITTINGTTWATVVANAGASLALDDLTDVTIGTAANGQIVQYNGSAWVNTALSVTEAQISDLGAYLTAVAEADVTQHQAALSITESQISDFGTYETADATILKDADIGVTVQAYDANLVSDATYVATANDFTTALKNKLDGIEAGAAADQNASEVSFTNTTSGLTATDVQAAIDEVEGRVDTIEGAGYISDYTVTESDVTAHQAALSITESQISDFGTYETADATILKDADIGVTVEAYDATILKDADIGVNVQAYDATILKDADIGVTVQAYDATYLVDADIGVTVQAPATTIAGYGITDAYTESEVDSAISTAVSNLINSAPAALDTLDELAAAMGDDANFATTMTNALAGKVDDSQVLTDVPAGAVFTDTTYVSSDFDHDSLTGYVANEHIDWTTDQGATNIHSGNYTNTTYSNLSEFTNDSGYITGYTVTESDVTGHEAALTITESQISDLGSYLTAHPNITAASSSDNSGRTYIQDITLDANGHITGIATATETVTDTTYTSSDFTHDDLTGFVANEHIDWTVDQGATNIHSGNYVNTTYSNLNEFTNGPGYITGYTVTSGDVTAHEGDLTITESQISDLGSYLTSVPAQSFSSLTGKPTTIAGYGITDAFDGAYGSLSGTPTIPTNNNQLTNGAGYITSYVNTTYSAGTGLDLSGTTFSIEPDLRDGITHVGRDGNDYIAINTTSIDFVLDGNVDVRIENDGDLHADGNVIAYSTTISDIRLKKDIVKIEGALDKVCALNGYTFEYIADGKKSAGVIAQEVEEVMPSAIVETALPLKTGTDEKFKTVQYDQLHGLLIEAIKELRAEIAELKGE